MRGKLHVTIPGNQIPVGGVYIVVVYSGIFDAHGKNRAVYIAGNLKFRETIDTIKYLRRFIAKKINAEVGND